MKRLDKLLIVDLEATCWDTPEEKQKNMSEIIEIGICALNMSNLELENKTSYLIQPMYSEVSKFCTELTSITPEMIASDGISFAEACEKLIEDFNSKYRTWTSWGMYDLTMMKSMSNLYRVPYPFSHNHINLKNVYSLRFGLSKELGLPKACRHAGIKLEGTHHRGDDDAWNTGKLAAKIFAP